MSYLNIRIRELLVEMRKRAGSVARLADMIAVSERTVWEWQHKTEEELHRLHQDNVDQIIRAARDLRVEPELFAPPPMLWDLEASYEANLGLDVGIPPVLTQPFRNHSIVFLGHVLNSPFGASASVLTCNSCRVKFLTAAGADVVTFKTVRSGPHRAHPSPNILCCTQSMEMLDPACRPLPSVLVGNPADGPDKYKPAFGMMNRFGMPSPPPEVWKADFEEANRSLRPGQLLILSVVGTAVRTDPPSVLLADFVKAVELAVSAGADIIELNLSCPNCSGMEGELYHNLPLALEICKKVGKAAGRAQIILKIGPLKGKKLREFVLETSAHVRGYSTMNTLAVEGLREGQQDHVPAFGKPGLRAGLSGKPILRYALSCVQALAAIRDAENLRGIGIIGIGGISTPQDVLTFLKSGADIVQATTAFFDDSLFGVKVRRLLDSSLSKRELSADEEEDTARMNWSKAVRILEQEIGGAETVRQSVRAEALADILEWERAHAETVSLGPRRAVSVPTVQEFTTRIRKRLGKAART